MHNFAKTDPTGNYSFSRFSSSRLFFYPSSILFLKFLRKSGDSYSFCKSYEMVIVKTCCYKIFQKEFKATASVWVLVHLSILAVCCVVCFFQNITKTFPNSWQTIYGYAVTLLVFCSRHTLHVRIWRIFRYLFFQILSKLRIIRHFLKNYDLNNVGFVSLRLFSHEVQLNFVRSNQTILCSG